MDLREALGDWPPAPNNQPGGGGPWPGQPSCPAWPGQPGPQPGWPGGQPGGNNPIWQGGNAGGTNPIWQGGNPGGNPGGNIPPFPGQPSKTSGHLKVPHTLPLPRGVYDKLLITIRGTVKDNPNMFTVDVTAGCDIAFHFNPRFNENGKRVIVCNSRFSGKWGPEERVCSSNFPFAPGQAFEMKILCTNSEYKVAVNGKHLMEYKHRLRNLGSIKQVSFYNDLTLSFAQTENLP